MFSKRNGSIATSNGVLASGVLALMAGSAFLFASVSALQTMNQKDAVTIDPNAWRWLGDLRLDLGQASEADRALLSLKDSDLPERAVSLTPKKAAVPAKKRMLSRLVRRKSQVAAVAPVRTQDQVAQTAAAPVAQPAAVVAVEDEHQVYQQMYRQLRVQFHASLEGAAPLTTQVAIQNTVAPATELRRAPAPRLSKPVSRKLARGVGHRTKAKPHVSIRNQGSKAQIESRTVAGFKLDTAENAQLLTSVQSRTGEKREISPVQLGSAKTDATSFANYDDFRAQTESTYRQITQLTETIFGAPEVSTQSAATQSKTIANGAITIIAPRNEYSKQGEYSMPTLAQIQTALNTQSRAADSDRVQQRQDHPVLPPAVVEAFEWNTPVADVTGETLTTEGWTHLRALNHWPVIYWNPGSTRQAAMISHNTAVALSKLADAPIEADAGIVFGKIPAGWNIEFSGRAEKVLYLNAFNQASQTAEAVRYFAFLNAAPGAQILTLKAELNSDTAAVAIPVGNGASTYLDLTAVTKRVFSGTVLNAEAQERKPVQGATVTVVGQTNTVSVTGSSGEFRMDGVFAVGDYPIYVETTMQSGFKHRYRVASDRMESVDLYRISESQVNTWLGQLEGGVSPESGLIVAAMPKLVRHIGDGRLFPSTHALLGNTNLTPETYTVTQEGQLEVGLPLEKDAPRFLSIQVPEGLVVTQLEDNNRALVWSELVVAQPGVINVILNH